MEDACQSGAGPPSIGAEPAFDLRQLRYFATAAEYGSLRKAAQALALRESTISRAIRDLEDEVGASLFNRSAGGVQLTVAGRCFLPRARSVLVQVRDGARVVRAIGRCDRGSVRVGVLSPFASGFVSELFRAYGGAHPDVILDVEESGPADQIAAVRSLGMDAAFLPVQGDWLDCEMEKLWSEGIFVALPERHPLAQCETLHWGDLVGEDLIITESALGPYLHRLLAQRLAGDNCAPQIHPYRVSCHNLLSLVALGRGLTIVNEAATALYLPGVVYRPLLEEVLPFGVIWSARNDNPALRRLLSMARSTAKERRSLSG